MQSFVRKTCLEGAHYPCGALCYLITFLNSLQANACKKKPQMLPDRADAKEQMEEKTPSLVKKSRTVTAARGSPPSEAGVQRCGAVCRSWMGSAGGQCPGESDAGGRLLQGRWEGRRSDEPRREKDICKRRRTGLTQGLILKTG